MGYAVQPQPEQLNLVMPYYVSYTINTNSLTPFTVLKFDLNFSNVYYLMTAGLIRVVGAAGNGAKYEISVGGTVITGAMGWSVDGVYFNEKYDVSAYTGTLMLDIKLYVDNAADTTHFEDLTLYSLEA